MTEREHDRAGGHDRGPLRKVGALWRPREGARSLGGGSITVAGMKQRFVILENRYKSGPNDPDYVLMSGDEPEPDTYASRRSAPARDERDDREYDEEPGRRETVRRRSPF